MSLLKPALFLRKRAVKKAIVEDQLAEDEKKKHTQNLIAKIDEQREKNQFHDVKNKQRSYNFFR